MQYCEILNIREIARRKIIVAGTQVLTYLIVSIDRGRRVTYVYNAYKLNYLFYFYTSIAILRWLPDREL